MADADFTAPIDTACRAARLATPSTARQLAITTLGDLAVTDPNDDGVDQRSDMVDTIQAFAEGRNRWSTVVKAADVYIAERVNAGTLTLKQMSAVVLQLGAA